MFCLCVDGRVDHVQYIRGRLIAGSGKLCDFWSVEVQMGYIDFFLSEGFFSLQRVTCLSSLPEDMTAMNSVIAFMILNAKELFKVRFVVNLFQICSVHVQ